MDTNKVVLEMKNIDKKFDNVQVLYDVDFNLHEGEIRGLIGENGAGKSTLMRILTGEIEKTAGEVVLFGNKIESFSVKEALDMGVSMVHQELNNAPNMTIAENMFIGCEIKKHGFYDKKEMVRLTKEYLNNYDLNLSPNRKMSELSVSEMQMVEIAKIASYNSKIIVMDEPTSSITNDEVEKLFTLLRKLKKQGVSIIYISHKLDELFELTDSISVMRDGHMIYTDKTENLNENLLIKYMIGREVVDIFPPKNTDFGEEALKVTDLSLNGEFENVSFSVKKGEVVGFSGLVGAGRTETMMTLFGFKKADGGEIEVNGVPTKIKSPAQAVKNSIALITEDRKIYGLNLIASVKENISSVVEKRNSKWGVFLNKKKKTADAKEMVSQLSIKCDTIDKKVGLLSGGNQQKIVLAKWLLSDPDIVILDEPTRGIDIGAKIEIYKKIADLAKSGKAVIMISSELSEIIGLCNRVVVMYEGHISGEVRGNDINEENIMFFAHGKNKEVST